MGLEGLLACECAAKHHAAVHARPDAHSLPEPTLLPAADVPPPLSALEDQLEAVRLRASAAEAGKQPVASSSTADGEGNLRVASTVVVPAPSKMRL